ncbi:MarR family winged helix-turn-helix transcriptional regulator [Parapedomonas caeni]
MADANSVASPLFLREAELRRGVELLYFAYRDFTKGPDKLLEQYGFGRAHHRALYFIARRPGLTVSDLLKLLSITKQSLSRVLNDLQAKGYVTSEVGREDKRQRLLSVTEAGAALEREVFEIQRERMIQAYGQAGQQAVTGFWAVLLGLIDQDQQAALDQFIRENTSGR